MGETNRCAYVRGIKKEGGVKTPSKLTKTNNQQSIGDKLSMKNHNTKNEKNQIIFNVGSQPPTITVTAFGGPTAGEPRSFIGGRRACDECCLPLHLYGENYIESYANGRAPLFKALCDAHASEFLEVQK
jgi:hypothetical protein